MRVGSRSRRRRALFRNRNAHRKNQKLETRSITSACFLFVLALLALAFTINRAYTDPVDDSAIGNLDAAVELLQEESNKLETKTASSKRIRGSFPDAKPWELWNISEHNGVQVRAHIFRKGYEPRHIIDGDPSTFWVAFSYPSIVDFNFLGKRGSKDLLFFNAYEISGHPEVGLFGQSPSSWVLFGSNNGLPPWHLLDEVSKSFKNQEEFI